MNKPPRKAPMGSGSATLNRAAEVPASAAPAPVGWESRTPFGLMRCDASASGRLVRLAEVLRWLETSLELPRGDAVERLCEELPQTASALQWFYQLQATGYAKPVEPGALFGYLTAERREEVMQQRETRQRRGDLKRTSSFVSMDGSAPGWRRVAVKFLSAVPEAAEPGMPALLKRIRAMWASGKLHRKSACDVLDDPRAEPLVTLAIRLDKAGELWGYVVPSAASDGIGQPSNWAELVAARKAQPRMEWTDKTRDIADKEIARRGAGAIKAMAADLNISRQALGKALKRDRMRPSATEQNRVTRLPWGR